MRLILLAALAAGPVAAADQARNGTFDDGLTGWWATQNLTPEIRDGRLCTEVPGGLVNPWDAIIGQDEVALQKGEAYGFSFHAAGDPKGPVRALVHVGSPAFSHLFLEEAARVFGDLPGVLDVDGYLFEALTATAPRECADPARRRRGRRAGSTRS